MLGLGVSVLYTGTVMLGLRARSLRWGSSAAPAVGVERAWVPPGPDAIPGGAKGDGIRRGAQLFTQTPIYVPQYARARLSCASCHANAGMQPGAAPMAALASAFPMYSARAGRMITLRDRIEQCFVRSENGNPLPPDSPEMQALVDYIAWLSQPQPGNFPIEGRGFVALACPARRCGPRQARLRGTVRRLSRRGRRRRPPALSAALGSRFVQ